MGFNLLNRNDKNKKESVEEQMLHWFERHGVCIFEHIEEDFEKRFERIENKKE